MYGACFSDFNVGVTCEEVGVWFLSLNVSQRDYGAFFLDSILDYGLFCVVLSVLVFPGSFGCDDLLIFIFPFSLKLF
jgi:hypothetical protein